MHFILIEGHIKHDTNCFCPVSFMLHLWVGNDNRKIGLVPCRKHPEQTSLTYYIAVEVCNREPNRVFRLMVHINTSFYLFFISRLLKAALKHDLRLIELIGKKWRIFFSLFTQNNPFPFDFFIHTFSRTFLLFR